MPGIMMSRRTSCGLNAGIFARHSSPLAAVSSSYSFRRIRRRISTFVALSSTIRIRPLGSWRHPRSLPGPSPAADAGGIGVGPSLPRQGQGQFAVEDAARPGIVFGPDPAVMGGDDFAANGQAQAGASAAGFRLARLHELVEHQFQFVRRNAGAFVADADQDGLASAAGADVDGACCAART